jgi:hypothetical protein
VKQLETQLQRSTAKDGETTHGSSISETGTTLHLRSPEVCFGYEGGSEVPPDETDLGIEDNEEKIGALRVVSFPQVA